VALAEIQSSMYKLRRTAMPSLLSSLQTSDQTVSASRFVSLGQSAFYREQVTAPGTTPHWCLPQKDSWSCSAHRA